MVKVKPNRRAPGPFKIVAEGGNKLDIPFALWGEMHNLILDVGNAVKRHKVTGKPHKQAQSELKTIETWVLKLNEVILYDERTAIRSSYSFCYKLLKSFNLLSQVGNDYCYRYLVQNYRTIRSCEFAFR